MCVHSDARQTQFKEKLTYLSHKIKNILSIYLTLHETHVENKLDVITLLLEYKSDLLD